MYGVRRALYIERCVVCGVRLCGCLLQFEIRNEICKIGVTKYQGREISKAYVINLSRKSTIKLNTVAWPPQA